MLGFGDSGLGFSGRSRPRTRQRIGLRCRRGVRISGLRFGVWERVVRGLELTGLVVWGLGFEV